MSHERSATWGLMWCGVAGALLVGILLRFGRREYILRLLEWLGSVGLWGPVVFVLIEIAVVILLLPGILFTLGAGFLFGPVWGTVYVVAGHVAGGCLAFLIARTFLGRRAVGFLRQRPRLRNLDRRFSRHGWKPIMLTRLIPVFPFKLSNYCFGVMHFRFRDFVIGTAIGEVPIALTNVYAGSLAADIAVIDSVAERNGLQWMLWGLGLVALLLLVLVLARIAQKSLNAPLEDGP